MVTRLLVLVIILSTACQSGIIPCPKVKTAKIKRNTYHKSFRNSATSFSADASDDSGNLHNKSSKTKDGRVTKNISVEEWDCPRPGSKKYLPKAVKENIRKNMRKIKSSSSNKNESDSLGIIKPAYLPQ
jgi:hypothetical protein